VASHALHVLKKPGPQTGISFHVRKPRGPPIARSKQHEAFCRPVNRAFEKS
jgi:hypothetical protein